MPDPPAPQSRAFSKRTRCLSVAVLWLPVAAAAQGWTGTIGANSEQVVRGVSETARLAALVGNVQYYSVTGWFADLAGYASRTRQLSAEGNEVTVEAGYGSPVGPLSSRLSFARHMTLRRAGERSDYNEVTLTASAQDRVFASVSALTSPTHASSKYDTQTGTVWAYDLLVNVPLKQALSINVGVGYQDLHHVGGSGYAYGNAGLAGQWRNLQLQLSYIATNAKAKRLFGDAASNRWVGGILWSF